MMNAVKRRLLREAVLAAFILALPFEFSCVHTAQVRSLGGGAGIALDADDIVNMMQRAGFDDKEILETGADLRNALAVSGTARIEAEKAVEAIFSVSDSQIFVSTRLNGNFVYDTKSKTFR